MLRAIIFDMDGVICDSEPLHMQAFQEVLKTQSIAITDQEYYDKYLAHDDRGSFLTAFKDHGLPAPNAEQLKGFVIQKSKIFDVMMKDGLVIYPGAEAEVRAQSLHRVCHGTGDGRAPS